ncbi:MAG TPA: hypothetical protein VHQ22_16100 [Terriglobales bacterium]|nr:hypothetical protein [Terriglobales bacterium]
MNSKRRGLSPELQAALEPLLAAIESVSQRIAEYNERIENLAQQSYAQGPGEIVTLSSSKAALLSA